MNFKKTCFLAAFAALLLVVFGPFAQAGGPDRELPGWAFAQRTEATHLEPVRVGLASTTPDKAAASVGVARLVRPEPATAAPKSEAIRAAVMQAVPVDSARVVVDIRQGFVYVRRGAVETVLPIEVRNAGADAKAIAEVAQAATADAWLAPYSIVVDGDQVGVRMKDGQDEAVASAVLIPELRQQTRKESLQTSGVATR